MDVSETVKVGSKAFMAFFFDMLETVVVAFIIFAVVYLFLASPHEVIGRSMEPNFHEGEFLLADKLTYRFREPERGEVIIFKFDDSHDYIKRVIATPGDTVKVEDGNVYINDEKLEEPYLPSGIETANGTFLTPGQEEVVPEGMIFAMGDNRPHSSDSRTFGLINENNIKGRAILRYWPLDEMTLIKKNTSTE